MPDDLINRKIAYAMLSEYYHHRTETQHAALWDALSRVPPAQPDVPDTNVGDTIRRQAAINTVFSMCCRWNTDDPNDLKNMLMTAFQDLPSAEPRWIPVKTRPMTEEERWNFEEHTGIQLDDEDAVFFDCKMPEDGQRIWISTNHRNVFEDFCENDGDFIGLEGNGDWLDVTAWMPMFVPDPWKG